jgi:hypothetical protein
MTCIHSFHQNPVHSSRESLCFPFTSTPTTRVQLMPHGKDTIPRHGLPLPSAVHCSRHPQPSDKSTSAASPKSSPSDEKGCQPSISLDQVLICFSTENQQAKRPRRDLQDAAAAGDLGAAKRPKRSKTDTAKPPRLNTAHSFRPLLPMTVMNTISTTGPQARLSNLSNKPVSKAVAKSSTSQHPESACSPGCSRCVTHVLPKEMVWRYVALCDAFPDCYDSSSMDFSDQPVSSILAELDPEANTDEGMHALLFHRSCAYYDFVHHQPCTAAYSTCAHSTEVRWQLLATILSNNVIEACSMPTLSQKISWKSIVLYHSKSEIF